MPKPADVPTFIKALHASYEARTGYRLRYNVQRERVWWEWCTFCEWEWTEKELARVIGYLRSQINIGKRNEGALKFENLIGSPDRFEEDLNLAKAAAKGNPTFQKKPSAPKPATDGPVNSFGEEVQSGADAAASFRALLSNPPRQAP